MKNQTDRFGFLAATAGRGPGPGLPEEDQGKMMLIKLIPWGVRSLYWNGCRKKLLILGVLL